jgi:hypothetical protein
MHAGDDLSSELGLAVCKFNGVHGYQTGFKASFHHKGEVHDL